jgi:hypothetical protein
MNETIESPKAAEKAKPEKLHKLKPTRLHLGEAKIRTWAAEIEEGTPYEALLSPVYWDVHSYKFAMYDEIRCIPDEGNYIAWLVVIGTGGVGGTRLQEIRKIEIGKVEQSSSLSEQFVVRYAGPHHKWRVERKADKNVEQSGFENEVAASQWLADNLKALSKTHVKAA